MGRKDLFKACHAIDFESGPTPYMKSGCRSTPYTSVHTAYSAVMKQYHYRYLPSQMEHLGQICAIPGDDNGIKHTME